MGDKCVKWSKEAGEFFKLAQDNSIVLEVVISHACSSQTGEGFEELVNTINREEIRRKIKKVNITDTSYLYRHTIPEFAKYIDGRIETEWYLKNKEAIEKIRVEREIKSWAKGLETQEYKKWYKQIMKDFEGEEKVLEFRDKVVQESAVAAYKNKKELEGCVSFMIEECVYACAHFQNVVMVYPSRLATPIKDAMKRYKISITHLSYKTSRQAQQSNKNCNLGSSIVDKEIALFMKEKVSNVNFFVIDKYGNHIYKNYALNSIVGDINAKRLSNETWKITAEVMKTKKQIIAEEQWQGMKYLVVKNPLIIEGEVEGVIGLAVDITARKRAEMLEIENKLQEIKIQTQKEFEVFCAQILHDIVSPLSSLEFIIKSSEIPGKYYAILREVTSSIKNIVNALSDKYKECACKFNVGGKCPVLVSIALEESIRNKKYQYKTKKVKFNYSFDSINKFTFINGDQMSFGRMMSNLLNNAVEACNKESGIVDVSFNVEDSYAKIIVKDNGIGMPREMIDKIKFHCGDIDSTKHTGHGNGLSQILSTIDFYNGIMDIKSKEGVGTTFSINFPLVDCPKYIVKQLTFKKGGIVVILDDDSNIFDVFKTLLKNYSQDLTLKFFTNGKDALDFIESSQEKGKIFFLSNYELRSGDFNGLTIILQSGVKERSIILTNVYGDATLHDVAERSNIKILLKQFLPDTSITLI